MLPEVPAALRAQLPLVGLHAGRDTIDVGNEPAADEPGVIGTVHALLARTLRGLRALCPCILRSNYDGQQRQASDEENSRCSDCGHMNSDAV
jgi:hypothetical protein